MSRELAFYLKGRPSGGGANSVVQEFAALAGEFGTGYLVVPAEHMTAFSLSYGWDDRLLRRVRTSLADLPEDVIPVATTNDSVNDVRKAFADRTGTILYYVQDYEPLFYPPHTVQHSVARNSYARPNDLLAVVKTQWLKQTLIRESFLPVVRIQPSINRKLFFPEPGRHVTGKRTLLAMVRPATPRRAPQRTVAIVNRLAQELGDRLDVVVFGGSGQELEAAGLTLAEQVHNLGRLTQSQVADLVRRSHFFMDLSDYQAFGRGLAEAMACGVVPLSTRFGAPPEFIEDGVSGWLLNPSSLDETFDRIASAVAVSREDYDAQSLAAVTSVSRWSIDATAQQWLALAQELSQSA